MKCLPAQGGHLLVGESIGPTSAPGPSERRELGPDAEVRSKARLHVATAWLRHVWAVCLRFSLGYMCMYISTYCSPVVTRQMRHIQRSPRFQAAACCCLRHVRFTRRGQPIDG
jgi:hypothetical protein